MFLQFLGLCAAVGFVTLGLLKLAEIIQTITNAKKGN